LFLNFDKPSFSTPNEIEISEESEIVFVSDMFYEDYPGGAEMTSEALISSSPFKVFKLHTKDVNLKTLEQGVGKFWIFGNFASLDLDLIPSIVANMKYSILEYDYKYCRYRSPEKHQEAEEKACDCQNDPRGKMISALMYGSKSLWWMSEKQQQKYLRHFPFLSERSQTVLSSVFDDHFFVKLRELREKHQDVAREKWLVIGSPSWIKGTQDAIKWCEENDKEYETVWGIPYGEILEKMAQFEGFVFLPKGGDTCPRAVIEAKLLGCKLHVNENVQHADEIWFDTDDMLDTESYLYAARKRFWSGIKADMLYDPTISGYTTTLNCIEQRYPFKESIASLLGFCDQVVVVDGGSSDGTWEYLQKLSEGSEKLLVHRQERDWNHKRFAVFDGLQKALARSLCTEDFCWQQDVDEIVHEKDYGLVRDLIKSLPSNTNLVALPVIEYWGGPEKVRVDVNPWKWRLSKNLPHITHGIPLELRRFDENGEAYAGAGTDGCDYIRSDTFQRISFVTFYTPDVENLRQQCLKDHRLVKHYESWLNQTVQSYPGIHHYSWFNINRKIKTYKNYWSKHWQSLYDITQEDTVENNMFFDKIWSEVSEEDIYDLSSRLAEDMGGWVFHSKVNFDNPTPYVKLDGNHLEVIKEWIKENE